MAWPICFCFNPILFLRIFYDNKQIINNCDNNLTKFETTIIIISLSPES